MSSKLPKYTPPSPFVPFIRRFTDERARDLADTTAPYHEVRAARATPVWANGNAIAAVSPAVAPKLAATGTLPPARPLERGAKDTLSRRQGLALAQRRQRRRIDTARLQRLERRIAIRLGAQRIGLRLLHVASRNAIVLEKRGVEPSHAARLHGRRLRLPEIRDRAREIR